MRLPIPAILIILLGAVSCARFVPPPQIQPVTMPAPPANNNTAAPVIENTAAAPSINDPGAATCSCPTAQSAPPPAAGPGGINPPLMICSCPAILVSPPIPATEFPPTLASHEPTIITLNDDGRTVLLHPGDSFLLKLGSDTYAWTVDVDNQAVLSRVINVMVVYGAQGIYKANHPGQAQLTARGNPLCRSSVPMCGMPSRLFTLYVIVA